MEVTAFDPGISRPVFSNVQILQASAGSAGEVHEPISVKNLFVSRDANGSAVSTLIVEVDCVYDCPKAIFEFNAVIGQKMCVWCACVHCACVVHAYVHVLCMCYACVYACVVHVLCMCICIGGRVHRGFSFNRFGRLRFNVDSFCVKGRLKCFLTFSPSVPFPNVSTLHLAFVGK